MLPWQSPQHPLRALVALASRRRDVSAPALAAGIEPRYDLLRANPTATSRVTTPPRLAPSHSPNHLTVTSGGVSPLRPRPGIAGRSWAIGVAALVALFAGTGCASVKKQHLIGHGSIGLAEKATVDPELDPARLEARGAIVGDILVFTQDVFDPNRPEENRALFRVANRLHPVTHPAVVESLLTFRSGDPFSERALAESERALRSTRFLYDARIRPLRLRDGRVDLEVVTRDMWTLKANVAFKRTGGENTTRFSLEDSNFLGSGKDFTVDSTSEVDRDTFLYRYRDQTLLGSRTNLELWYGDNSDGKLGRVKVERPFFSLDSRWAAGFHFKTNDRVDPLYTLGKVVQRFRHEETLVDTYYGLGRARGSHAHRWQVGFTFHDDKFEVVPGVISHAALPRDRRLAYPWLGYRFVQDRYVVERNLDRIDRSEDINLGLDWQTRLGYSPGLFGAVADNVLASTDLSFGIGLGQEGMLRLEGHGSGRLEDNQLSNVLVGGAARFYRRTGWWGSVFYASLSADATQRRDAENQLLLGGDTGLRGFPLRYQDGDRRLLLTLEQRFYTDLNILQLFNIGGAVFFDAGKAWFSGPAAADSLGVLKDIGIGLRISNSRSSQGGMIHIDLAMPLDRQRGINGYQILVSTAETF
jgi:hypothetical protein